MSVRRTRRFVSARPAAAVEPELPQELRFLRVLWALDHALQVMSKRMRGRIGITAPQRLTLRLVDSYGELGAGELAALLHLHPATLTGILERLVRRKLLVRGSDTADRRRVRLSLAPKGRRLTLARAGTVEHAVTRTLAGFSRRELRATTDVLARLARELASDAARLSRRTPKARRGASGAASSRPRRRPIRRKP